MKNKIFLLLILSQVLFLIKNSAQSVGISAAAVGSFTPNANAMLDISSTTLGLLVPKSTTLLLPGTLAAAAQGLLFYNTTSTANFLYVNNSNSTTATWATLPSSTLTNTLSLSGTSLTSIIVNNSTSYSSTPLDLASTITAATWNLSGNAISSGNFIGTTGAQDLVMAANGIERMRIANTSGNVGIGTAASNSTLEVSGTIGSKMAVLNANNTSPSTPYVIGASGASVYFIGPTLNLFINGSGANAAYSLILPVVNASCGFLNRRYILINATTANINLYTSSTYATKSTYTVLYTNSLVSKLYYSGSGGNNYNASMEILADPISNTWIQIR